MKNLILLGAMLALAGCQPKAGPPATKVYVQLVRGNNEQMPPEAAAKPIGLKLESKLRSVFGWENYWELKREEVMLGSGERVRKRLSPEREVELELKKSGRLAVCAYSQGRLAERLEQPLHSAFVVAGGKRDDNQSWFVVVRRDKPTDFQPD